MDSPLYWVFLILALLVGFGFSVCVAQGHKESIREILHRRGERNIRVSWVPLDFDRGYHTYDVEFLDAEGKRHHTTCKAGVWDSVFYWKDES